MRRLTLPALSLVLAGCSGTSRAPAPPVDASALVDASASGDAALDAAADGGDDDAGASTALTLDYTGVVCAEVEAVASNDGGVRLNEICDFGRGASPRYLPMRDCVRRYTDDDALVRRVADEGAYVNPSLHPHSFLGPCANFVTLYPAEQARHALWCARAAGRCNDDGSLR